MASTIATAPGSSRTHSSSSAAATCDVGLIGLGVMGENLILNMADHGYRVAVFNRTVETMRQFVGAHAGDSFPTIDGRKGGLVGCVSVKDFLAALKPPRVMIVLVKAGPAVDAVCKSLIDAGIEPNDLVVDTGNSLWTDTIRREREYAGTLKFFGSGVSGGELGARFGPSLMPGGDEQAWKRLKPIWDSISAKVDSKSGKPILGGEPGKPVIAPGAEPCSAYIGPNGAGHYVKMVHNGIEYGDMQLICEAYFLMKHLLGLKPDEMADVFAEWNTGDLDSFLIEITADILQQRDPVNKRKFFVDVVMDTAGQKGTGKWTSVNALDMGVPAPSIAEAVFARCISAVKEKRTAASKTLKGPRFKFKGAKKKLIEAIRDALYCSKICSYAQGFDLMAEAQKEYQWKLNFGEIAMIWRGGCIIRARFLQKIKEAYDRDPKLPNLLLDPYFKRKVGAAQANWRKVVSLAAEAGVACPVFMSALSYFDSYRTATLPANLLQAQRDYFGAHTYERVDQPRGKFFHVDWPHPDRPQIKA
jgi:6-phosphogluconate dehydrogenase